MNKKINTIIIGLGRIGTALAERSKSIFKNILFYDPLKEDGYDKALGIKKEEKLINLFKNSDVISLHAPSTEKNKFFLEEKLFKILNKRMRNEGDKALIHELLIHLVEEGSAKITDRTGKFDLDKYTLQAVRTYKKRTEQKIEARKEKMGDAIISYKLK